MRTLFILVLFMTDSVSSYAQITWKDKIDDSILRAMERQSTFDCLVMLSEQADLSDTRRMATKKEKGQFVFEKLRQLADKTQPELWKMINEAGVDYRSFHLVNAIQIIGGNADLIERLARSQAVFNIQPDPWVRLSEPHSEAEALQLRSEVTWGLDKINAPAVWELGYKGQGVVIAGQDTGYEWDHPAIRNSYRGWEAGQADHNYNWHDAVHDLSPLNNDPSPDPFRNPCGVDSRIPCDDHNHGTHTMGTMTGNDESGVQIGVAPAARWIGCRNMERGWGRPSTYMECFEWFLAPTNLDNNAPDPSLAPHVINNSWGCPEIEGCNPSNWALMEKAVENLRSAGIVVVVSAGNSGSRGCGSVSDAPAIFEGSFSVGSSTVNDGISGFSSRGPVLVDGSERMKPNVVAPGSGVRSAIRNGNYATWSGTSMAGPHAAGAVAIIISANPQLAGEVDLVESILEQSAIPLSTDVNCGGYSGEKQPNPFYGYGRIDLLAAVKKALDVYIAPDFRDHFPGLTVFPNPFHSEVTFRLEAWPGDLQLRLTDALGRQVARRLWTESDGLEKNIALNTLPQGLYFYQLSNEEQSWNGTLVRN